MSELENVVVAAAIAGAASVMPELASIDRSFRAFVNNASYPCLGARAVVRQQGYRLGTYGTLGVHGAATALGRDLLKFSQGFSETSDGFGAFVAVFPESDIATEEEFEKKLWEQLSALHQVDGDTPWAADASADPDDPRFSFSFGGRSYFVVGLHPMASRVARRFDWPALVFNPRSQFTRLREDDQFERMRTVIRERDIELQGTPNPMLADFGDRSEAKQYSGRETEAGWKCPFHRKAKPTDAGRSAQDAGGSAD